MHRYGVLHYYHNELYSLECQFHVHIFLIDLLEKIKQNIGAYGFIFIIAP